MKPILTILFLFSVLSGRANDYFDITNSTILSVSNGSAMTATGHKCDEHKVPKPPPPPTMWWTPLTNNIGK